VFSGCWTIIKGWLDERTRKKIQMVSSEKATTKKLLEFIDEDQIPTFLGGKLDK